MIGFFSLPFLAERHLIKNVTFKGFCLRTLTIRIVKEPVWLSNENLHYLYVFLYVCSLKILNYYSRSLLFYFYFIYRLVERYRCALMSNCVSMYIFICNELLTMLLFYVYMLS